MSTRSERAARKHDDSPMARLRRGECLHCGHKGAHYVPPSTGDHGFFACESFCAECRNGSAQ